MTPYRESNGGRPDDLVWEDPFSCCQYRLSVCRDGSVELTSISDNDDVNADFCIRIRSRDVDIAAAFFAEADAYERP